MREAMPRGRRSFGTGWRMAVFRVIAVPLGLAILLIQIGINALLAGNVVDRLPSTTLGFIVRVFLSAILLVSFLSMFILPIVIVQGVGRRVRLHEQRRRQVHRDAYALSVASARERDTRQVCLYLRPFNSTGHIPLVRRLSAESTRMPDGSTIRTGTRTWGDIETILAERLEPELQLIALGRPGEHVGAGRIAADDNSWQSTFEKVAALADYIVVVPSEHEGTMWELRKLAADPLLLSKTTFIIPGEGRFESRGSLYSHYMLNDVSEYGVDRDLSNVALIRADACKALATFGLALKQSVAQAQGQLLHVTMTADGSLSIRGTVMLELLDEGNSLLSSLLQFLTRSGKTKLALTDFKSFITRYSATAQTSRGV
jgi:hypothetical protein